MGCVPASVLADQGANPVFDEQLMVSSHTCDDIGTATRGDASRLNRGPLKMAPAPNCTGFSLDLQSSQMERATILDDYGSNCEQTAPHLWGFIEAFVHDKPYVSEIAHELMYFWVLAYRSVTLKNTLVRCKRFCVTYDESTLLIFYDKVMKNAGALPSVLKKNADSKGYTLYDLLVDCARSRSPVIPIGDTPAPAPSVVPLSTVSGSVAPTLDDIGHQPEPSPAPDIDYDIGTPPLDMRGDQPSSSDDDPKQPLLVHLPPALPHDLGPGLDDSDDTVQPLQICALPAPPTDDHLGFARLTNGAHDDDSSLEVSSACVASLQLPSSSSDNRDVLEHGFFYKATLDSSPDYYGDPTLLVTPYAMILPATAPLFILAGGRPPDLHPRPGPATIRAPLHHGQLLHSTFAGPDIFYLQHGEMDIDDMFAASFSHDHFSSWYDDVVLHYLVASFLFICVQIPWLLILGPALLLITGPLTPTSWDFTNPSPCSVLHSSIQVFKPWLHVLSILGG